LIVGDDEIAAGSYTLKDMKTGEQQKLGRQEIIDRFTCQTR
jgi:histidyl-tRNA synthetase